MDITSPQRLAAWSRLGADARGNGTGAGARPRSIGLCRPVDWVPVEESIGKHRRTPLLDGKLKTENIEKIMKSNSSWFNPIFFVIGKWKKKHGRKDNVQGLFSKISLEAIEAENLGMLAIPGDTVKCNKFVKFGISSQTTANSHVFFFNAVSGNQKHGN